MTGPDGEVEQALKPFKNLVRKKPSFNVIALDIMVMLIIHLASAIRKGRVEGIKSRMPN